MIMSEAISTHRLTGEDTAVNAAFEALKIYDAGSGRAALCPLDEGIISALPDAKARRGFEERLLAALKAQPSGVAIEYICSKLALIGSDSCIPALAELVSRSDSSTAARNALEKIPGNAASKALRGAVPKLDRAAKVGAIESLGVRRDAGSVALLAKCLKDPAPETAAASVAALGQIGSTKAAKALQDYWRACPKPLQPKAADAMLECAERLIAEKHTSEAKSLFQTLAASPPAPHIQQAAALGLRNCVSPRSQSPGT